MNRLFSCWLAAAYFLCGSVAAADTFGSGANSFEIEFVTVGNPGNPPDITGNPNPAGSVPYSYRIGKYEISEQMINKVNALGGLGITKNTRGPNRPATDISWYEAARLVNWLNDDAGYPPAYKFDDVGNFQLWQPSDPGYMPGLLFRSSLAKYFLPSVNEWFKAAYFDSAAGVYFDYPTGSNSSPASVASGTTAGSAVYQQLGPADINQAGGLSLFGTMGQGGNAAEWMETSLDMFRNEPDVGGRAIRGGDWGQFAIEMSSQRGNVFGPSSEFFNVGFRVASVIPEPDSLGLLAIAWLGYVRVRTRPWNERRRRDGNHFS